MSDPREGSLKERDEGLDQPSLDSMEILNEETEIGDGDDGGNEGDDEHLVIKEADTSALEAAYRKDGSADYFRFATVPLAKLADNGVTHTINDWYLRTFQPVDMFGKSQSFLTGKFNGYEVKSGYDKAGHKYSDFVEDHRPLHAMTEGGKGIAMYTRPVIYLSADMSTINNINITFGCPSNCSFCKESILARGYTQLFVEESTGVIKVELEDGRTFQVPSKTKAKYYDTHQQVIVYGPLSAAIVNQFPIATDSLEKLRSGDLVRLLSD